MKRLLIALLLPIGIFASYGLMLGPNLTGPPPDMTDTTAPVLTAPYDQEVSTTTAGGGVTTNESGGTMYFYISTSATPPSAANLKACGASPAYCSSLAVPVAATVTYNATGLTQGTTYYSHFLHRDDAGNDSAIATADGFTTVSSPCTLTGGSIADNATVTLTDGNSYRAQNGGDAYAAQRWTCNQGVRFEVRSGDKPSFDAADVERSELYSLTQFSQGTEFWCAWSQREVNAIVTSTFVTSPQGHHSGSSGNPPWSLNYTASKVFHVYDRDSTTGPSGSQTDAYNGGVNFLADNLWHDMVIHLKFNLPSTAANTGIHEVWIDGTQVVNLDATNIGFQTSGTPYYMKLGIYRGSSSGISKKDYSNWECSTSSLLARVASPRSVEIP
jgi:hypothetical protein